MRLSITTIFEAPGGRLTRDRSRSVASRRRTQRRVARARVVGQRADPQCGREAAADGPENVSRPFLTRSRNESNDDRASQDGARRNRQVLGYLKVARALSSRADASTHVGIGQPFGNTEVGTRRRCAATRGLRFMLARFSIRIGAIGNHEAAISSMYCHVDPCLLDVADNTKP
jgi:hypothetical protein